MRRDLIATIAGTEAEVELAIERTSDGRWVVSRNGHDHQVDAVEIRPGTWSLLMDGRSFLVDLDRTGGPAGRRLAHVEGQRLDHSILDAQRYRLAQKIGRAAGKVVQGELVRAPIAGKVVKVLVAVGEDVALGQGVAVLEAMKMENEIRAEKGGKVTEIHSAAGKSVDTGEPLMTLT